MVNMTLAVPGALYSRMQEHAELKWSEVARKAFNDKLDELDLLDDLRAIRQAEKEHMEGKTISELEMAKLVRKRVQKK